jgi:hypothetical protein
MNPRITFILVMLGLLLVANFFMISGFTNYPTRRVNENFVDYFESTNTEGFVDLNSQEVPDEEEGFTNHVKVAKKENFMDMGPMMPEEEEEEAFMNSEVAEEEEETNEGFMDLNAAAPYGSQYQSIGTYDNLKKTPEHGMSDWRGTAPNEALLGPEAGPDDMFIFKNNQCKPECCGASFSCGSGCVCTTPKQRDLINSRGGNRTAPTDSL